MSTPKHFPYPVISAQNLGTMYAMIKTSRSQIGYKEGANNDTFFGSELNLNHLPWCHSFISVIAKQAGCGKIIPWTASTVEGMLWYKAKGLTGRKPVKGALHYVWNDGLGRISHVELVIRVFNDGSFMVIGGNTSDTGSRQGDGVYKLKRTTLKLRSTFAYPKYKEFRSTAK